jgi:hypothetical protein
MNSTWKSGLDSLPASLIADGCDTVTLSGGETLEIRRAKTAFRSWPHEIMIDTFGGKPVLDVNGEQTFAEVAIVRLFRPAEWNARWLESYAARGSWPRVLSQWHPGGIKFCEDVIIEDERVRTTIQSIIDANGGKCSGCWDAVAWSEDRIVFCEAKRSKRDRLSETQRGWMQAALRAGFTAEHFLVLEWDFA